MELYNDELHTNHITMEELDKISAMDRDDLNESDIALLKEIGQKMDSCSVCHARYLFFLDSEASLALLTPKPVKVSTRVADILQEKITSIGTAVNAADAALQEKLSQWLESTQNILGSFERQLSLQPGLAGGLRGGHRVNQVEITLTVSVDESGFFEFELPQKTKLKLEVSNTTDSGKPVCLVVFGREETVYSEVYLLSNIGNSEKMGTEPRFISIEDGKYVICIPTIDEEFKP